MGDCKIIIVKSYNHSKTVVEKTFCLGDWWLRVYAESIQFKLLGQAFFLKLVIAIAKCQQAKQKLEDDRTELCNY